jgi:hypothetical protein
MKKSFVTVLMIAGILFQAAGAFAQTPKKHRPTVGDIEDQEIERIDRRVKTHQFSSFGFGPFGSSTSNKGGVMYGLSYGKHWEANENGEIRFDAQAAANSASQYFGLNLGYGFLPFTSDISPIFGAELGAGYAGYKKGDDSKNAGGFGGGAFTGLRFFRTADTQLELLASYHAVFAGDVPGVYGLQLRILY